MSRLAATQRAFIGEVLDADGPRPWGIDVYRRSVQAAAVDALAASYPVVMRLVGAAFFGEAVRRFARAQPSRSGDLGERGRGFADFLDRYEHAAGLGYLADVARLEWAMHESAAAADAAPFDFVSLARVPPEAHASLVFALHPSVRLLRCAHAALPIWGANQPGCDGSVDAAIDTEQHLLVHRMESGVQAQAIEASTWRFLRALGDRVPLGAACEVLDGGATLATVLPDLCTRGVITGFECGP